MSGYIPKNMGMTMHFPKEQEQTGKLVTREQLEEMMKNSYDAKDPDPGFIQGHWGSPSHPQTPEQHRIEDLAQKLAKAAKRTFATGATRDTDEGKNDYEGFLSPLVIEAFGDYMTEHRVQSDGTLRDSDNWQKGIPRDAYMKSLWRHVLDLWKLHRGYQVKPEMRGGKLQYPTKRTLLCSIMFNTMGYLHELLKEELQQEKAA